MKNIHSDLGSIFVAAREANSKLKVAMKWRVISCRQFRDLQD
jgi:hypothetical protein